MWEKWNLDDNGRAEVPLDGKGEEHFLTGMGVDFSSVLPVQLS